MRERSYPGLLWPTTRVKVAGAFTLVTGTSVSLRMGKNFDVEGGDGWQRASGGMKSSCSSKSRRCSSATEHRRPSIFAHGGAEDVAILSEQRLPVSEQRLPEGEGNDGHCCSACVLVSYTDH